MEVDPQTLSFRGELDVRSYSYICIKPYLYVTQLTFRENVHIFRIVCVYSICINRVLRTGLWVRHNMKKSMKKKTAAFETIEQVVFEFVELSETSIILIVFINVG